MLRAAVLFFMLVIAARPAAAQLSISDLKHDLKKLDTLWLEAYNRAIQKRDVFASIHDSIKHGAYNEMVVAKDAYLALKKQLVATIETGNSSKGTNELVQLEKVGEALGDKVSAYLNSSKDAVEKIQIGLGVVAFLIAGGVFLIFKKKKTAPGPMGAPR
jgi:nucleoside diphosphate kinase